MTEVYLYHDEWWMPVCQRRRQEMDDGFGALRVVPEELVLRYERAVAELREARNAVYEATDVPLDNYDRQLPEVPA